MRAVKIIGITLAAVFGLIVVALLAVRLLVDPNDYKDRIAREVKSSTGRELMLSGPIELSLFPWIALQLGPASLGNPPGFSAEPFAAVRRISLRVKLLPLLRKELKVGSIEIDGLDLRLVKNPAGKGNWQDFSSKEHPASADHEASTGSGTAALQNIGGIKIKDSRISYQDLVAEHLDFELGRWASGTPTPVKLSVTLIPSPGASPVDFKFSAPALNTNLTTQILDAPAFTLELAGAKVSGSLEGTRILDAPAVSGTFKLDTLSPRDLLDKLAIKAPTTRDPKALTRLAASGGFTYGSNAVSLDPLAVDLDDSRLQGRVAITNLQTKAMALNLALNHIDLDAYRAPAGTAQPAPANTVAATQTNKPAADPLKTLRLDGKLSIGGITVSNVKMTDLRVTVVAKDGLVHIAPATANFYGGHYSGDITLNDQGPVAQLKLVQTMSGVDMAALLKDFARTQRVSGHGTVTTDLTAQGLGGDAFMKTLNGRIAANIAGGALEGVDLWFEVERAKALLQKQGLPNGQGSGRTKFDAFQASADITNGIAKTTDLNIASQNLRVTGQGSTNLVTNAVDYQVKATLYKDAPTATAGNTNVLLEVPLNVTGSTSKLNVRPDLEAMARSRAQQELDKRKGELQQKLMDKLKGILK
jgi:AsmA protein